MPLKDDWVTSDSFAAADENAVASQVNDNTDWIAAVTATAAELNALDGITSTVTELNYTDGVTSSIQTQLDTKYGSGGTDVSVPDGGTGRSTGTTAYALVATGTTATGAQQTLASGATTEILVGGGAAALPVWTTAQGSGAPVRATSPALTTPNIGTPSAGTLTNCTGLPVAGIAASTATAVGVGSVELGHATDTTLSRASAGVLAVEGVNVVLNGGALGTPASGTLTNCTGLPVAGIAASTATAVGVGSIELGHASDTTLSRTGAGAIAVEGVAVALNSTSVSHTASTIELGAASDTTLSRASAGVLAVEGVNVLLNGGALGTPSSGTATNLTGLPVAGITASTSSALGVGTLELGHASDTTLSRSASGKLAVEGVDVVLLSGAQTLTGKTLTSPVINTPTGIVKGDVGLGNVDNTSDATKDAASTTLTNKTLTNPTVNNYTEGVVAIGNTSTAKTIDLTSGTVQTATLTGNCTFTMPTATAGKSFVLLLKTGAGSFTGTFTGVKWPTAGAPTITTAASKMDILTFVADGASWYGSYVQGYTP